MLSCQQTQNVIDGKKRIILNPSETQKRDFESATFSEDEVYGIDILISSGEDGKVNICLPMEIMLFTNCTHRAGPYRRFTDHNLPKRGHCHLPTQNEKLACCFFGSPEESGSIPVQCPLPRRRKTSAIGSAGSSSAWLNQTL
jgi:hypothetical protein